MGAYIRGGGGGGLITGCIFLFPVNGPITGGLISGGAYFCITGILRYCQKLISFYSGEYHHEVVTLWSNFYPLYFNCWMKFNELHYMLLW